MEQWIRHAEASRRPEQITLKIKCHQCEFEMAWVADLSNFKFIGSKLGLKAVAHQKETGHEVRASQTTNKL